MTILELYRAALATGLIKQQEILQEFDYHIRVQHGKPLNSTVYRSDHNCFYRNTSDRDNCELLFRHSNHCWDSWYENIA